jgi:hypothetical protein
VTTSASFSSFSLFVFDIRFACLIFWSWPPLHISVLPLKIMAIYIGLKLKEDVGATRTYSFFRSDGALYGTLAVDTDTAEIFLLHAEDNYAREFAFPRARRAIEKALERGNLPDELCYAA